METASEVLLLIVSGTLVIFLAVSIVAVVKLIQILNQIKHVTQKAEKIADTAENIGNFFQKAAIPSAIAKIINNFAGTFKRKK